MLASTLSMSSGLVNFSPYLSFREVVMALSQATPKP